VVPLILLLTTQNLAILQAARTSCLIKGALDRTAAEISLLCALGGMSDPLAGPLGQDWTGQPLDPLLKDLVLDIASTAIAGPFVIERVRHWLGAAAGEAKAGQLFTKQSPRLYLDWKTADCQLWLGLAWSTPSPWGEMKQHAWSVAILWTGSGSAQDSRDADAIWSMDNFSRGRKLRQLFGGNLPDNYPVIAAAYHSEIISIKSVDLTAPSYQDPAHVRHTVMGFVRLLADFDVNGRQPRQLDVELDARLIKSRRLRLIIPNNSTQPWLANVLDSLREQAAALSVTLEIVYYGQSQRYALVT
jgi:hypothetical protein